MPSPLGVVIVTYNSTDVVLDCLETLLAATIADGTALHVAVVDNASSDGTAAAVQAWASGKAPYTPPTDLPFAHHPVPKPLSRRCPDADRGGGQRRLRRGGQHRARCVFSPIPGFTAYGF